MQQATKARSQLRSIGLLTSGLTGGCGRKRCTVAAAYSCSSSSRTTGISSPSLLVSDGLVVVFWMNPASHKTQNQSKANCCKRAYESIFYIRSKPEAYYRMQNLKSIPSRSDRDTGWDKAQKPVSWSDLEGMLGIFRFTIWPYRSCFWSHPVVILSVIWAVFLFACFQFILEIILSRWRCREQSRLVLLAMYNFYGSQYLDNVCAH